MEKQIVKVKQQFGNNCLTQNTWQTFAQQYRAICFFIFGIWKSVQQIIHNRILCSTTYTGIRAICGQNSKFESKYLVCMICIISPTSCPHRSLAVQFIPPQMSYHFWTEEEGALLVAAVKKYGFRWEEIQFKVFPGLTVAKLKNKFYSDRRFKADAALPLTDEEKLGLKRRKRAPVPVEAKEAPSSEVDVDQLVEVLKQLIK
ncbi:Conserved_hypothetical protein [Hexamita inflata]|uniref:Myb-like domain-containing protein n=1 Tax=Hexamita inflata TaxID=28002 RepID=A0AA86NB77_9EUKA|nr:Conserved hypothetical protein [Hexamita inflata]